MTAVTTGGTLSPGLPHGRPLTRADLEAMPDNGHRYELLDGVLVVSPSPARRHQRAVLRLARLLAGDGTLAAGEPFPVRVTPQELVAERT